MPSFPFRPSAYDAPRSAVVAAQAHALGLPDVSALADLERWADRPLDALRHHQAQGDLGQVLVLHLVAGVAPRSVGVLAARWCERIPSLDRYPPTRRVLSLAQQPDPDVDVLLELARVLVREDAPGSWTNTAVAHAAMLACRRSRIGAGVSAWACGSALERVLVYQLGALPARDVLVELARQPIDAPSCEATT